MKNILKNKKKLIISICSLIIILIVIFMVINNHKDNKLENAKNAIENVFFFLPNEQYDNLNEISDYCKISLVYGTNYLNKDVLLSKEDLDTKVKRNGIKAYTKENILNSVKSILGDKISINFEKDENDEYKFLEEDDCRYGNKKLKTLSYNENKGYVYSIDNDDEDNMKLFVKWENPEIKDDIVTWRAKAFIAIKNADGGYDIYADNKLEHKVGEAKENKLKSKINDLYLYSKDFIFTLKKVNNKYIWTNYKIIDKFYNDDYIVD